MLTGLANCSQEGVENVIQIKEFDAQTVRRMVEFLYTGDYDQGKPEFINPATNDESADAGDEAEDVDSNCGDDLHTLFERRRFNPDANIQSLEAGISDINLNAYQPSSPSVSASERNEWGPDDETAANEFFDAFSLQLGVHAIADYYMIKALKREAIEKVKVLLKKTLWSTKGFLAVAKEAFETTTPSPAFTAAEKEQETETLRDIIIDIASDHFTEITDSHDFARSNPNPEFAAILLQKAAKKHNDIRAELKQVQRDNFNFYIVNSHRAQELMKHISDLQAQVAALEDCIQRVQELSTCQVCGCAGNVLIREEVENDTNDDDGYDADGSVDGSATGVGAQERKVKKYVIECKQCNLQGVRSGDLLQSNRSLFVGDDSFQGTADLSVDELPAEPWLQGENDQFAGTLYPDADADDI